MKRIMMAALAATALIVCFVTPVYAEKEGLYSTNSQWEFSDRRRTRKARSYRVQTTYHAKVPRSWLRKHYVAAPKKVTARKVAKAVPVKKSEPETKVADLASIPRTIGGYIRNLFHVQPQADLSKVPVPLKAFLNKVQTQCGRVVAISGFRRGSRVAGSGRLSLHALNLAVDYKVANPSCALKVAKTFPGGHSIDYGAVNHFHASYGGREWGSRFAHYGNYRSRYRQYGQQRYRRTAQSEWSGVKRVQKASGIVSFYGWDHAGRRTANGERFNPMAMTCAHPTARFGTRLKVTNAANGRSVVCRVNDRGPSRRLVQQGRVADLALGAFRKIASERAGLVRVRVTIL